MAKIRLVIPIICAKFFGGLEFSLLVFTDEFVVYLRNIREVGSGALSILSPLASPLALIAFGLSGKAREFMESLERLRGIDIEVCGLESLYREKGGYVYRYSDIERLRVSKGIRIVIEVYVRGRRHRHVVALGLYREIGRNRDEVYREIVDTLKSLPVKPGILEFR